MSFKLGWAVQVAGWAFQTLAAYLIPLAVNFAWIHGPETMMREIANYIFFLLAGLFFGIVIAKLLPGSTGSGQWVWIAPVGLLVFGTVLEMRLSGFDLVAVWFGMGEAGWAKAFVTWPTLGCCTYSAAMKWERRRRSHSTAGAVSGPSSSIGGQR